MTQYALPAMCHFDVTILNYKIFMTLYATNVREGEEWMYYKSCQTISF